MFLSFKKSFYLFLLIFVLPQSLFSSTKEVLIINSYHRGFQWSDDVVRGIEKVFYDDINININILYMDSKRINSKNYYDRLVELYKIQLEPHKYDLIIAVDRFAYDFIIENYYKLFKNEPILFTGLEKFSFDEIKEQELENRIYGIFEDRKIQNGVESILKIIPKLKKLYIINDGSANGNDSIEFINNAISTFSKNTEIELIRNSTIDDLIEKFSEYKKDEAIFFIRFYNDKFGNFYNNNRISYMLENINLPVFITDTLFIGKGATGGKLVQIDKLGELTGKIALEIIHKNIKAPYFTTADDYKIIFDKKKIDKYNLNPNYAYKTDKVEYINLPPNFFDKYRDFINFFFVVSPIMFLFLIILFYNIHKRIKSEKKLSEAKIEKDKHKQFIIQQSKLAEIGEVFSSIAHQWKTPLVEISTIVQEYALQNQNNNSDKFVEEIMIQVKYMTDTINDFQKFIIPSNEKIAFNVVEAIKSMMEIIEHNIKYNYIDVKISQEKNINTMIYGYKNEFMQTLLNIVNNARDQIIEQQNKKILKRGFIEFYIYNENSNIIIEISDNGGGIKKWMMEKIFDAYFTTKNNGHGIGLYMSKLIIETKMQGKIEAFNKNNGLCFRITIGSIK